MKCHTKTLNRLTINNINYKAVLFFQTGQTGFYFDDKQGWSQLPKEKQQSGFPRAQSVTSGFTNIREPGESLTITLVLEGEDGRNVFGGSCAAIQYSGAGGRDMRFHSEQILQELKDFNFEGALQELIKNPNIKTIRKLVRNERGTAKIYGLGQLFLQVAAFSSGVIVPEFIAKYILDHPFCPEKFRNHFEAIVSGAADSIELVNLPLFIQTGDNRGSMVEEVIGNSMIFPIVAYPHGLFNSIEKVRMLPAYLELWTQYEKNICGKISPNIYFHCDTYGQVGEMLSGEKTVQYDQHLVEKVGDWILEASKHTEKKVRIEGAIEIKPDLAITDPVEQRKKMIVNQAKANAHLLIHLCRRNFTGQIVSDENINSVADMRQFLESIKVLCQDGDLDRREVLEHYMIQIKTPTLGDFTQIIEAALYCASQGVSVYIGGTCNETNISAGLVYTVAAVLNPLLTQVLVRPGMDSRMGLLTYADWQNTFIREFILVKKL